MFFLLSQGKFHKKKEASASFFRFKVCVKSTYFTMNFMVFSKPLAFTVTK